MIDLDQPPQYGTPPNGTPGGRWRRLATVRALAMVVVVSLLAGAVLGGVAAYIWWYRPLAASVERAEAAVSVVLFAESSAMTVHNEQERVRLETQVTVVNAGPVPVSVLGVRVDQPGVTLRSSEKQRLIQPAATLPVDVVVEFVCDSKQTVVLDASVRVEPTDEQVRDISPVALDSSPWIESRLRVCSGLG
ncbi:hypothetical protein AB0J80_03750 [Actinoplanes sp. NPDC049548]|uniref:hypothetical protein n=1 Tax=Actinoplanes sp. NPDC049548 TaxID=3155152 RepID=UPI00343EC75B